MREVIFDENFRNTLVVKDAPGFYIELSNSIVDKRKFSSINTKAGSVVDVLSLVFAVGVGPKGVVYAHVDGMVVRNGILLPQAFTVLVNLDQASYTIQRINETAVRKHQGMHDAVVRVG